MKKTIYYLIFLFPPIFYLKAQSIDTSIIKKIKKEAIQSPQVMDYAFYISDFFGPRLTGSPAFKAAGEWVIKRLHEFNLENIKQQPINWGRGWSYKKIFNAVSSTLYCFVDCFSRALVSEY